MGDWTAGIGILIVAVLWIQIFMDYRRKLVRLMPNVSEVSGRRQEISTQISDSESSTQSIHGQILSAKKEIEDLEERRIELQAKLNPQEMVLIPAAKLRMGSNDPTKEDENPEHHVEMSAYYIDKMEVTNLQYKEFVAVTGHRSPSHWRFNTFPDARKSDHPFPGKMPPRTPSGSAKGCPPRRNGSGRPSVMAAPSIPGVPPATPSRPTLTTLTAVRPRWSSTTGVSVPSASGTCAATSASG